MVVKPVYFPLLEDATLPIITAKFKGYECLSEHISIWNFFF